MALITAGSLSTALIASVASAPAAIAQVPTKGPLAITLSAAAAEDHADRIATLADDLNDAYLVAPSGKVDLEVVNPSDTPDQAAAALANVIDLAPSAEAQVADEAELHEDERAAMARVHTTVLKSTSTVQDISAVRNSDGTQTLTANVHTKNEMGPGWTWQEITPYVVTVDPKTNEYTSLDVQYNLGGQDGGQSTSPAVSPARSETMRTPQSAELDGSLVPTHSPSAPTTSQRTPQLKMSASGKAAAVRYAEYWWNKRNPAYRDFGGLDCTNFVSQALLAGGWAQNIQFTTYRNGQPVAWFYNNGDEHKNGYSPSWTVADNFYLTNVYALDRIYNTNDRYALREGDVLQWKTPDNNGKMTHTTLVTGYSTEPHLTYHANNEVDFPMSAVAARLAKAYPQGGVKWYPMAVR